MEIIITESAQSYLNQFLSSGFLILFYETEGCGCAVNGVPVLNVANSLDSIEKLNLLQITTKNGIPLYMYKKHTVFFDDELKIEFINNKLKLSSKNQVFAYNMSIKKLACHE